MKKMEDYFKSIGCVYVFIDVFAYNKSALMFKEVNINCISSGAVKDNVSSCKIFEKLGFNKIGEVIEESPYTFYNGLLTFSKYELTSKDYFLIRKI